MQQKLLFGIVLILLLGGVGFFAFLQPSPKGDLFNGGVQSNDESIAVKSTVTEFGENLQKVSLLAPAEGRIAAMDAHYAPFVNAELLAEWKKDPSSAPGRNTSSPWPQRIEIHSAVKQSEGVYHVEGVVIEVAGGQSVTKNVVATYPVSMEVAKEGEDWHIISFTKGAYSEMPKSVTLLGVFTCLPHKDTRGPTTLECAFGIKTDNGAHYALDLSLIPMAEADSLTTGGRLSVTGVVVPVEALSSDHWWKYDIKGIMRVESATSSK